MPTELDLQLTAYFAWVEEQAGTTLRRPGAACPRRARVLALSFLVVAVVVAGIGLIVRRSADDRVPVSPTELNERFQRVQQRVEAVSGTFFDQRLSEWETGHQIGLQIQRCLADRGIDPAVWILPDPPDRSIDFRRTQFQWWAWPDEALAARTGYGVVKGSAGFSSGTGKAGTQEFGADLLACQQSAPECCEMHPAFELSLDVVAALSTRVDDAFAAPSFAEPRHRYESCIRDAGYDFTTPDQIFDSVLERELGNLGFPTDPSQANYQAALDIERAVAVGDMHCRLAIGSELIGLVERTVAEWEATDSDRIAAATQAWIDLRARAYGE